MHFSLIEYYSVDFVLDHSNRFSTFWLRCLVDYLKNNLQKISILYKNILCFIVKLKNKEKN